MKNIIKQILNETFKHNNQFLYHTTNIKNYDDIEKYGLLPDIGETIKTHYGEYYDFDGNREYDEDDYEAPIKLDFDGILFFSEYPMLGFSTPGNFSLERFDFSKALVCVVKKNRTIFRKLDNGEFVDYKNEKVYSIDNHYVDNLPIFIERGDWFSFERQKPVMLLEGRYIIEFMKKNFPEKLKRFLK